MASGGSSTFEDFTLDRGDERLLGPDGPVHLGNKAFRVLQALVDAGGQLLTKDALFETVWQGTIVSDSALTSVIKELRRALGDETRQPRFIESVYGRGYRFIADPQPVGATRTHPEASLAIGNLPHPGARLIGREADLDRIVTLLASPGVVTISGSGGVGKSRFALEAAHRVAAQWEDGAWLVELAALSEPGAIPEAIARALRIELPPGDDAARLLTDRLRLLHCLIVIDNCEHLLLGVAELVEAIARNAPQIMLLLTSQEPVAIAGEQVHRLAPLEDEAAAALFVERVAALDTTFDADPEREAIAALCSRLDGLPLALEMAAARIPALGCAAVLERLDDRFRLLTSGQRTALPRQQTLHAALDLSHAVLGERDAIVLRRLGVFAGSFALDTAAQIVADEGLADFEVVDALASLSAKSLIVIRGRGATLRYILLETVRAYARGKLEAAGELAALRRRHAEWCAAFAEPVWEVFCGPIDDETLIARYESELGNIAAAVDWAYGPDGDDELGHRLVAHSATLWSDRPLQRKLDIAIPRIGKATPAAIRARLLSARAHVLMRLHPAKAIPFAEEAVAAVRKASNSVWTLCDALCAQGFALWSIGRVAEARRVADELKAITPRGQPSRIGAFGAALDACVTMRERGPDAARPLFRELIADLRSIGAAGHANFWQATAMQLDPSDDVDVQIADWRDLLRQIAPGDLYAEAVSSSVAMQLVGCLARRALPEDLEEAVAVARQRFKKGALAFNYRMLLPMASVALGQGRTGDAARLFGHADALRRTTGEKAVTGADFDRFAQELGEALGDEAFAREAERGAALTAEAAVALALGDRRRAH